jgi:hypothetical protein
LFSGAIERMCHQVTRFLLIGARDPVHTQQG